MCDDIPIKELKEAYQQTKFELVNMGGNNQYELPVSEPACYNIKEKIGLNKFEQQVSTQEYLFISPYFNKNYLSSKIYDSKTNEFFHIKINSQKLRIYPKSEEFSFETFQRFVNCVNNITYIELEQLIQN